jgi:thioredoxin-dependent peroxiredoxin
MADLKEGDKAPAFSGRDQNSKLISLDQYKGKKLILYFYPKDNTPGCTDEACNLRDNYSILKEQGFEILGVSADSEKSHQGFIAKHDLPFPLLADLDKKVIQSYGAWGEKKMYGKSYEGILRSTFVIDEKGIILKIFHKVETKEHSRQILDALR